MIASGHFVPTLRTLNKKNSRGSEKRGGVSVFRILRFCASALVVHRSRHSSFFLLVHKLILRRRVLIYCELFNLRGNRLLLFCTLECSLWEKMRGKRETCFFPERLSGAQSSSFLAERGAGTGTRRRAMEEEQERIKTKTD